MAKSKVTPGWVGPLKQAKDGKQPYYCEYGDWTTGDKLRHNCGAAGKKKDAEAEWIKFRQNMESKTHTPSSTRTFGHALDEYEAWIHERHQLKQRMSGNGLIKSMGLIRNHIRPKLGHVRLDVLDSHMVQKVINDLSKRGFKCAHKDVYICINEVLKRAAYKDWLPGGSPLDRKKVDVPPVRKPETSIPSIEEGRAIWHSVQEQGPGERIHTHVNRRAALALAMFGGCERGVVAELRWDDVDWIASLVHISRSFSVYDGPKAPKNEFRIRTIPMGSEIRESLSVVWMRDGMPTTGYVFSTLGASRAALYSSIYTSYLVSAMRKAGFADKNDRPKKARYVPRWSYHELRHYAGSVWLEAGASLHDVSRMLGHSSVKTTEKYYIHYFKKQEAQRHRAIADLVSNIHQIEGSRLSLPSPMREKCEINAEDIEIIE
jgi:integrase